MLSKHFMVTTVTTHRLNFYSSSPKKETEVPIGPTVKVAAEVIVNVGLLRTPSDREFADYAQSPHNSILRSKQDFVYCRVQFSRLKRVRTTLLIVLFSRLFPVLSGCGGYVVTGSNTGALVPFPATVTFGAVPVGQTASASISLLNATSATIGIANVDLSGQAFALSGQAKLPVRIAGGKTYNFNVQFNPADVGTATANLIVISDVLTNTKVAVSLNGTGITDTPGPSALSDLFCESASMNGPGTVACTVTLGSAASGGMSVSLSSSNPAVAVPANVNIAANAASSGFIATVTPVGTAQAVTLTASLGNVTRSFALLLSAAVSTLAVDATTIPFGDVVVNAPATQSVAMTSTGAAPVTIKSATVTGKGFAISGATPFPFTLNPRQTAALDVEFDPLAVGPATGQLTISSDSSTGATSVVSLSGTGLASSNFASVNIGTTPGRAIPSTFMGLSHEWGSAQTMMGDSSTGVNTIYRQLLKNLSAYGSGPIVLRIGGNSSDKSGEPASTTTRPFAELATDLGVHFYLGVNLGSDNVNLGMDQAKAYVSQMPAGFLDGIEIGNEPDMYRKNGMRTSSYSFRDYLVDFKKWKTSILPLLPSGIKLMGPSWAVLGALSSFQAFDAAEAKALTTLSQHYYVANGATTNPDDILLTPNAARLSPSAVAAAVATTHGYGIPFRMGEINSLYNGGENGISNTFQSALWAVDTMFAYTEVGVDGVNWHCGNGGAYAAFSFSISNSGTKTNYTLTSVRPLYYGLLFFQAATGNGAHLLPVTVNTHSNLTAWATVDASNTARLVMINKSKTASGTVNISLNGYSHAQIYRLTAPSYQSTSGVTFAGQTFDGSKSGAIQGTQISESVNVSNGVFEVPMPITSAALVVFTK
jgi:hypothetical protein